MACTLSLVSHLAASLPEHSAYHQATPNNLSRTSFLETHDDMQRRLKGLLGTKPEDIERAEKEQKENKKASD